jgi:hypothetical protein
MVFSIAFSSLAISLLLFPVACHGVHLLLERSFGFGKVKTQHSKASHQIVKGLLTMSITSTMCCFVLLFSCFVGLDDEKHANV